MSGSEKTLISNETLKTIKQRRSTRSYKPQQITDDELQAVLGAGLYAPHAGDQAWHFTVVQNRELLDQLNLAAKTAAKLMDLGQLAELGSDEQFNCFYHAPTLILVSGDGQSPIPLEADCAAATQNMLLAAESIGLGSCWIFFVLMAFQSPHGQELRELLKIPKGYRPYAALVLGYKEGATAEAEERKPNLITYIR